MTQPSESSSDGRTIAVGDIHGCEIALDVLLGELNVSAADTLVVLGDVVDRGPDTRACIDRLLELSGECRLVHIMGNHEEMMLDAMAGGQWSRAWRQFGGQEMLESYGGAFDDIPDEHLDFIKSGRDYYQTETTIFAHAAVNPAQSLDSQRVHFLRWNRLTGHESPHVSGRRIICGHTAQSSGKPVVFDGWVCLDTCVYGPSGALSAMVLEEDTVYRADQRGKFLGAQPLSDFA